MKQEQRERLTKIADALDGSDGGVTKAEAAAELRQLASDDGNDEGDDDRIADLERRNRELEEGNAQMAEQLRAAGERRPEAARAARRPAAGDDARSDADRRDGLTGW